MSPKDLDKMWSAQWSENELEYVHYCPICRCTERKLLHEDLIDNVFFAAYGRWNMQRCMHCHSAYLDPRPDQRSIGKAYSNYYTHSIHKSSQPNLGQLSCLRKFRRAVSNSYLNQRFGTHRIPSYKLGYLLALLLPHQRQLLDSEFRYLQKPDVGQRLLDIGCGNGAFLAKAKAAGWAVTGIDSDPKAVQAADSISLNIKAGSIVLLSDMSDYFDAITLSHVVEHVHEPIALLKNIYRLLKPGGMFYIETPNIDSFGSKMYKKNWRGIEAPRHLVLFNHKSLHDALERIGFKALKFIRRRQVGTGILQQSENIKQGRKPLHEKKTMIVYFYSLMCRTGLVPLKKHEFITLVARKTV